MRLVAYVAPLLAAGTLTACNGGDGETAATWSGPPEPDASGVVDVQGFVDHQDAVDEPWEGSAAMAAGEFLRLDERTAARTTVEETSSAEGAGPTRVVVTLDGLFDDSVRAERWTLDFVPDGDGYELTGAIWGQRCQPGRGHQEFTPEPCT